MLRSVAVMYHPQREQAIAESRWLEDALRERGVVPVLGNGWDPDAVQHLCCDKDLVVALGGDGTIIHVARLAAPFTVPIVGVNLGRVGFLAALTPDALHHSVDALTEQRYWIENHTMLDVTYCSRDATEQFLALNEVTLARGGQPHALHVRVQLDGDDFLTYTADGVLVATATGSTAYSLAAGGPILYPESRDMLITPVAPHLHIGRSTVISGDTRVTLSLSSKRRGMMMADGDDERPVTGGDWIDVRRSELVARFARLSPRSYFYAAIASRMR